MVYVSCVYILCTYKKYKDRKLRKKDRGSETWNINRRLLTIVVAKVDVETRRVRWDDADPATTDRPDDEHSTDVRDVPRGIRFQGPMICVRVRWVLIYRRSAQILSGRWSIDRSSRLTRPTDCPDKPNRPTTRPDQTDQAIDGRDYWPWNWLNSIIWN